MLGTSVVLWYYVQMCGLLSKNFSKDFTKLTAQHQVPMLAYRSVKY